MKRYLLFLLLLQFITLRLVAQLSADFETVRTKTSDFSYIFRSVLPDTASCSYLWNFGDGKQATGPEVNHQYTKEGRYLVSLTVTDGRISDTRSQEIQVEEDLNAPNVFTPNDDTINDVFIIDTDGQTTYTLTVYSRSGTIVHRSTSKTPVWDGKTPSGEYLHPGIYYYVIRIGNESGDYKQSGFVHLIRELP